MLQYKKRLCNIIKKYIMYVLYINYDFLLNLSRNLYRIALTGYNLTFAEIVSQNN